MRESGGEPVVGRQTMTMNSLPFLNQYSISGTLYGSTDTARLESLSIIARRSMSCAEREWFRFAWRRCVAANATAHQLPPDTSISSSCPSWHCSKSSLFRADLEVVLPPQLLSLMSSFRAASLERTGSCAREGDSSPCTHRWFRSCAVTVYRPSRKQGSWQELCYMPLSSELIATACAILLSHGLSSHGSALGS